MSSKLEAVRTLADGKRSSVEIGQLVGLSPRYIRRLMARYNLPQLTRGAQPGANNHQFVSGRRVDPDGYVLVTAGKDHPSARHRTHREGKLMFEHRLVMEQQLGRHLRAEEVVDHIDGLRLHNDPKNLRLFPTNAAHLRATLSGNRPRWSESGYQNIGLRTDRGKVLTPVDTYGQRRKRGEIRLQQILLAALSLGIDSPYLLGTHHHTKKARIDMSSRSTIERALADLYARWG